MSQFTNEAAIWRYNDCEFEFDLTDVDNIELYEKTFAKMQEDVKNMPKDGNRSAIIRAYCRSLRDVFDSLFGAGTSDKLFGSRYNATEITVCYESFLEFVTGQNKALSDLQNRVTSRYSPNRAQRRATEKK